MEREIIDFIQKVFFWLQLTPDCEFGDGGLLSASATVLRHCDDASGETVIALLTFAVSYYIFLPHSQTYGASFEQSHNYDHARVLTLVEKLIDR